MPSEWDCPISVITVDKDDLLKVPGIYTPVFKVVRIRGKICCLAFLPNACMFLGKEFFLKIHVLF